MTVRLARDEKATLFGFGTHRVLDVVTEGQECSSESVRGHDRKTIGLVFRGIGSAMKFRSIAAFNDARIVASRNGIEVHRERPVEHGAKLDRLIASHTWIRGASCLVLREEVIDDLTGELLRQIPHVEGDAEHVGYASRVARVVESAAPPRTSIGLRPGEREMHPDDLRSCVDKASRCDRRVDTAGHGGNDTHVRVAELPASLRAWHVRPLMAMQRRSP